MNSIASLFKYGRIRYRSHIASQNPASADGGQSESVKDILHHKGGAKALQAKLKMGRPGDSYEREADQAADSVVNGGVATTLAPSTARDSPDFQPMCRECTQELDESDVQAKEEPGATPGLSGGLVQQVRSLRGGQPLSKDQRSYYEPRFGRDFSQVRVHVGNTAAKMTEAMRARAFTHGSHIVFNQGEQSDDSAGRRLLAHELAHVVQQSRGGLPTVQRQPASQISNRDRFATVHRNLFIDAPGTGSTARQTWGANTSAQIIQQFKTAIQNKIDNHPLAVLGTLPNLTSEAAAESTAIQVDQRIRTAFPQISGALSQQQIRNSVSLLSASQVSGSNFINQWLANRLFQVTRIGDFTVDETDGNFQSVLQSLSGDSTAFNFAAAFSTLTASLNSRPGWSARDVATVVARERRRVAGFTWAQVIQVLASRTGAFVETSQSGREIFLSQGLSAAARTRTLIHELTHFYAHDRFKEWVATTTASRFYEEGFTEYLARRVMTPQELQNRNEYQQRVDAITQEVAPYVSLDDIARAYYTGEVWRLENQSQVAQRVFGAQTGLHANADRATEVSESSTSRGIVQTVVRGSHYRFMNLGVDSAQPKAEHEVAMREILAAYVMNNSAARIRFVGHTSTTGSAAHNLRLGQQRATEFYALARRLRVSERQLVDAANPATRGESELNVTEDNRVIQRAFNRRVELFIS